MKNETRHIAQPPLSPSNSSLQGVRIMVIDDNVTGRYTLQRTLQTYGCFSIETANGLQGLKLLGYAAKAGQPFDLLLLDTSSKSIMGLDILKQIRQQDHLKTLPIILLTSIPKLNKATREQACSWSDYLTKPVKQSDLITAIITTLNQCKAYSTIDTATPPPTESPSWITGLNILLVEDNEINSQMTAEILQRTGYQVTTAENGSQALEQLEKNGAFDLILMDIMMPGMNGIEATKIIRKNPCWQKIPIIALTSLANNGDGGRFLAAGMDDYLCKTVLPEDMIATIKRHLSASVAAPSNRRKLKALSTTAPLPFEKPHMVPHPIVQESAPASNSYQSLVFNHTALLEQVGGRASLLEELIVKFLRQAESQIPEISATVLAKNMKRLSHVAHSLKGSAAMMGAERLKDAAHRLEMSGRENSLNEASAALADLIAAQKEFQYLIETRWPHLCCESQPA